MAKDKTVYERTIRFISSNRSDVNISENSSSQLHGDELHEFRKNFEKYEIHVHHMGHDSYSSKYEEIEWFSRPEEILSNVQVNKLTFQGDIMHLSRAFKFATTIKNLNKVQFTFGKRKLANFQFGIPEKMLTSFSVTELEISFDRKAYMQDSEAGKTDVKNLIISTMEFSKKCFPAVKILKLYIPKTNGLKRASENLWNHYFKDVKFVYNTLIRDECETLAIGYVFPRSTSINEPIPLQIRSNLNQNGRTRTISSASTVSLSEKPLPPPAVTEHIDDVLDVSIGELNVFSQSNFPQSPLIIRPPESEHESETDSVILVQDGPPCGELEYERRVAPSNNQSEVVSVNVNIKVASSNIKGKTLEELRNLELFCRRPSKKRKTEEF